jgi:hypothetical protein
MSKTRTKGDVLAGWVSVAIVLDQHIVAQNEAGTEIISIPAYS